ncbi:MurR/RpiR family transcriptional regulator [Geminicoccaceae bacterium 1502E]|nr:MurR/RpiR family transcriptional regulator [Geminicoccaceae bacterium 1502E]
MIKRGCEQGAVRAAPPETVDELRRWLEQAQATGRPRLGERARAALVHMLDDPHGAAVKTISQIAEAEGVDPSTITRLGQRLGFEGFSGLQQVFRRHVGDRGGFYSSQAYPLLGAGTSNAPDFVRNLANDEIKRLSKTVESLRTEDIDRAAEFIAQAENVYVLGMRATHSLAFFLGSFLRHLRPRVHLIGGAEDLLAGVAQISPQDVLVAFSFRPYTKLAVEACRAARVRGVPLVAVSDTGSPIASEDEGVVTLYARSPFYFNAAISNLFLAEVLASAVAQRLGDRARSYLGNLEDLLKRLDIETS